MPLRSGKNHQTWQGSNHAPAPQPPPQAAPTPQPQAAASAAQHTPGMSPQQMIQALQSSEYKKHLQYIADFVSREADLNQIGAVLRADGNLHGSYTSVNKTALLDYLEKKYSQAAASPTQQVPTNTNGVTPDHPPPPYPQPSAPTAPAPAPTPSVSAPSAPPAPPTQNYKPVLRYEVFGANKAALNQVFLNLSQNFLTVENEDELLSDVFTLEEAIDSGHTTLVVMDVSAFLKETISSGRHKLVISFSESQIELAFSKNFDKNTTCVHIDGYDAKDDLYEALLVTDADVWDEYIISTKVSFSKNKEQGLFTRTWNWVTGNDKKQEPAGPVQTTVTATPPTLSGGFVPTLSATGPAPTSGSRIYVDDDDEDFVSRPSSELTVARAYLRNVTIHHNKATNQITSVAISVGDVKKVMSTPHYKNKVVHVYLAVYTKQGLAIYNITCPEGISNVDVNTIEFNVNAPVGSVAFWVFTSEGPFIKKQGSVEFDPVEDQDVSKWMYSMARDHATVPRIFYGTSSFRTRNKSTRVVGLRMWETMGESVQTAPVVPKTARSRESRRALTYGHGYASATPQPQKKPTTADGDYFMGMFGSGPAPPAPRVVGHVQHAQSQPGPTPQNNTGQGIAQMTGELIGKGVKYGGHAAVNVLKGSLNLASGVIGGLTGRNGAPTTSTAKSSTGFDGKTDVERVQATVGTGPAQTAALNTTQSTASGQGQPAAGQPGGQLWLAAKTQFESEGEYVDNILNFFGVTASGTENQRMEVANSLRSNYFYAMRGTTNSSELGKAAKAAVAGKPEGYLDYNPTIANQVVDKAKATFPGRLA